MVSKLFDLTSIIISIQVQCSSLVSKLEAIKDVETLDLISAVCQERHPNIAEAASAWSDRRTTATYDTRAEYVHAWVEEDFRNADLQHVEDMTLTELKHVYFGAIDKNQQVENRLREVARYWHCRKSQDSEENWVHRNDQTYMEIIRVSRVWLSHLSPEPGVPALIRPVFQLCCSDKSHRCPLPSWRGLPQGSTIVHNFRRVARALADGDRCVNISVLEPAPDGSHPQTNVFGPWFSTMSMLPWCGKMYVTTTKRRDAWSVYYLPFPNSTEALDWLHIAMRLAGVEKRFLSWSDIVNCTKEEKHILIVMIVSPGRKKSKEKETSPEPIESGKLMLSTVEGQGLDDMVHKASTAHSATIIADNAAPEVVKDDVASLVAAEASIRTTAGECEDGALTEGTELSETPVVGKVRLAWARQSLAEEQKVGAAS